MHASVNAVNSLKIGEFLKRVNVVQGNSVCDVASWSHVRRVVVSAINVRVSVLVRPLDVDGLMLVHIYVVMSMSGLSRCSCDVLPVDEKRHKNVTRVGI